MHIRNLFIAALLAASLSSVAHAQDKSWTEEQFVKRVESKAQQNGRPAPAREELVARFKKLDIDGDGVATFEERQKAREMYAMNNEKKKKRKKKKNRNKQ